MQGGLFKYMFKQKCELPLAITHLSNYKVAFSTPPPSAEPESTRMNVGMFPMLRCRTAWGANITPATSQWA